MAQFLGFGNGSDGVATLSGTDAPIDSSCTGTSGTTSLSATNASFAAGQIILIHQTRAGAVGSWELNQISSYSAGTITTLFPLSYTYSAEAQVLVLKQYSSVTISGTLTAKAWPGSAPGGIVGWLCSGTTTISGTLTGVGKGFIGGAAGHGGIIGRQSEGSAGGGGTQSNSANGNGAGGGGIANSTIGAGGGGAGSSNGSQGNGGGQPGAGGGAFNSADGTSVTLGGGGGGGHTDSGNQTGATTSGNGSAMIFIFSNDFLLSGSITVDGQVASGEQGEDNTVRKVTSGSGGGGFVFIKAVTADIGTNLITAGGGASLGASGSQPFSGGAGGAGGIRVEACQVTGSCANPGESSVKGGFDFCSTNNQII